MARLSEKQNKVADVYVHTLVHSHNIIHAAQQ